MNLKEKVKSYSFWVSLASAVILVLKVIGSNFGFTIDETLASDLITSLCSVLVIMGIIVTPTPKASNMVQQEKTTINETTQEIDSIEAEQIHETIEFVESLEPEQNEIQLIEVQSKQSQIDAETNLQEICIENNNNPNTLNPVYDNSKYLSLKETFEIQKQNFAGDISEYIDMLEHFIAETKNNV